MMGCCRTGGAFGFPDRRWSRDPLVWLCLFEEETAIPVQVPAPSWESKRPSSSGGCCLEVGHGLINWGDLSWRADYRCPETRMVLAGPKRKEGDGESRVEGCRGSSDAREVGKE